MRTTAASEATGARAREWHGRPWPIDLACGPLAVELADARFERGLRLGALVEDHPAWTLMGVVENSPHQGLADFAKLAAGTKGWT